MSPEARPSSGKPSLGLYRGGVVGLLRGFSQSGLQLEIDAVVPHRDAGLPGFGEFLMVECGPGRALVGRVCQYRAAGRLMSDQGDSYLADLSRTEQRPPAPIVRQMLRYTLTLQLLGQLQESAGGFRFRVGDREFPAFGSPVREPSETALAYLCNVNLAEDPSAAVLGELAYGQRVLDDVPVKFSVERLKGRRSFVFARAGYGKSNLIKYLVSQLYSSPPDVGLLIFDVEGEYALPDAAGRPGMADIPALAERLSLYTDRTVPPKYAHFKQGDMHLDFGNFPPQDIIGAFLPAEKQEMVFANLVRGQPWEAWKELVAYLNDKGFQAEDRPMGQILRYATQGKPDRADVILAAIKNNLVPPIRRLHRGGNPIGQKLVEELRQGRIVIADTSLLGSEDAHAVSGLLLKHIFDYNRRHFTDPTRRGVRCLAVIEEAQAVLGARDIDDRNVFVRWVKEGRKYDLGVMLVTQQPGAIADAIISQGDNFFVLHLLNDADLATLKRHNAYFADDILGVIRSEPIPGNCYFWSAPDQPFVLPVRVREFGKGTAAAGRPKRVSGKRRKETRTDPNDALRSLMFGILGGHSGVWLYPVAAYNGQPVGRDEALAFAFDYLLNAVANRVGELGVLPSDDPAGWVQHQLPASLEQILTACGGRHGYAVLASTTRKVWVLPAAGIQLTGAKQPRRESVHVRAAM